MRCLASRLDLKNKKGENHMLHISKRIVLAVASISLMSQAAFADRDYRDHDRHGDHRDDHRGDHRDDRDHRDHRDDHRRDNDCDSSCQAAGAAIIVGAGAIAAGAIIAASNNAADSQAREQQIRLDARQYMVDYYTARAKLKPDYYGQTPSPRVDVAKYPNLVQAARQAGVNPYNSEQMAAFCDRY
jgi:ABC-type Zn2+ transport system substrate-binding protein/surface adhesin